MDAASSGERTHSEAGCEAPTMVATAVPHDPAPITATRSLMRTKSLRRPRSDLRVDPYTVSVSRATVPAAQHAAAPVDARRGPRSCSSRSRRSTRPSGGSAPPWPTPSGIRLVRAMAVTVVAACAPLPVAVVCDDEDVAQWATELGAAVMWEPGQGLNGAVRAGVDRLARAGAGG